MRRSCPPKSNEGCCHAAFTQLPVCCQRVCACRYTYLLDLALQHAQPLLLVGASGTGKTSIIAAHILNGGLQQDLWVPVCITLSSRTSANMLQEQVTWQHQALAHATARGAAHFCCGPWVLLRSEPTRQHPELHQEVGFVGDLGH